MRRLDLDSDEIARLYVEEGWRASAIAAKFGCGEDLVYEPLERAGVSRSRSARLPIDALRHLYVEEGWSTGRIAVRFGVNQSTVSRHLRKAGIAIRRRASALLEDQRRPCPPSIVFRAYALGLVWGDFSAGGGGPRSAAIQVRSSTTRPEQVALARDVFGPFAAVTYNRRYVYMSLDLSFRFLQEKYVGQIPKWIKGAEASAAFLAGYVDAEGSFGVYEGRARFKMDSYDKEVLHWTHKWCRQSGIRSRLRCITAAGTPRPGLRPFPNDLWRLNVNEGLSVLRLVATLDPYLRHAQRRSDAERARQNIVTRLRSRLGEQQLALPGNHQPR